MNPVHELSPADQSDLADRLKYEAFLAELSLRFINQPPDQVDGAIEDAQRFFCENLGLERSSLYQRFEAEPGALLLTHIYEGGDNLPVRRVVEKRVEPKLRSSVYWVLTEANPPGTYIRVDVRALFPWVYQQLELGQPLIISSLEELPEAAAQDREIFRQYGTRSTVVVPLAAGGTRLGCITFASLRQARTWSKAEVRRFCFVADVFANALMRKRADEALRESEERLGLATESSGTGLWSMQIATRRVWASAKLREIFSFGPEEDLTEESFARQTHPEDRERVQAATRHAVETGEKLSVEYRIVLPDGKQRWISSSGRLQSDPAGTPERLMGASLDITERKANEQALVKSYAEIKQLKDQLQAESDYLRAEIKVSHAHGEILGRSPGMRRVLHQVEQVAPADCPVLISGETGTGKELIAQEIHRLSGRKDRVMVLVNCAALPSALVESELFGRERGAYTGALTSQAGRFEVANGSTIFLDEVGELSKEVQAKLLRVLQQGEFQRLGNPKTHKVDVRVMAATNRDLAEEVRKGRFREDLYYRLRVFPIDIPPLRQRVEDIPLLVFAFMEEFSTRMGKKITKIPRKAMEVLQAHAWPGNIRELRNVIEHSVILTGGDTLKLAILGESPSRDVQPVTLAEAEREHILKTLESTAWRIKGPHGAAARLDLQPSTLYSRMQRLGIPHRRQKDAMS